MDTTKIKFYNNYVYLIKNMRFKSDILQKLKDNYNVDPYFHIEKNYSDNILDPILSPNTIVCSITNGFRHLLYLTKINNECITILINMNIKDNEDGLPKLMIVPLSFNNELFDDTILIGDIVSKNDSCHYLVERCLLYNGRHTYNKTNIEHIKLINHIVYNKFTSHLLDTINIKCKSFTSIREIEELLKSTEYNSVGIRFYSLKKPVVFYFNKNRYNNEYTHTNLLPDCRMTTEKELEKKEEIRIEYNGLKSIIESTRKLNIDNIQLYDKNRIFNLRMKPTENYGIYILESYTEKLGYVVVGKSRISTIEMSEKIINYFKNNNVCRVKCIWNNIFDKFEIIELIDTNTDTVNIDFTKLDDVLDHIEKSKYNEKPIYANDD